jgi:hypothetical protein
VNGRFTVASHLAIREMNSDLQRINPVWLRDGALITLGFSLFLGLIGPFGDYQAISLPLRVASWLIVGFIGYGIHAGLLYGLERIKPDWPWLRRQAATAFTGAGFITPLVIGVDVFIAGDLSINWFATYWMVLGVSVVFLGLYEIQRVARMSRETSIERAVTEPTVTAPPRFLRRVPKEIEGQMIGLMKEDHYLRIYTDQGDALIRLRMSDAVDELEGMAGLQTHRSWWVADEAVVSAKKRSGGGAEARLSNGLTAPIARARVPEAQAAGWFDR